MTLFWLVSLLLILLACAFIGFPLLKGKAHIDNHRRDELNKAFYLNRLDELKAENDHGVVENEQEMVAELKQSLLNDVPLHSSANQPEKTVSKGLVFGGVAVVLTLLSVGLYSIFGDYADVKHWQNVNHSMPQLTQKLLTSHGNLTVQEMEDLTLALRTRLHEHPQDSTGWLMLGRIAMAGQSSKMAVGALERAYRLSPDKIDIQLTYAQALIVSKDKGDQQQGRELLKKMAKQHKVDFKVYSLLAFDAAEHKQYQQAIDYWQDMQKLIKSDDPRYAMLAQSIDQAKRFLGNNTSIGVPVTVTLSSAIPASKGAVLIVSVHSADGAPMPVAAARFSGSPFPQHVVLTDDNNLTPNRRLSDLKQVIVKARVDMDGNVSTKHGDWVGESAVQKIGDPVKVTINKQQP